MCTLISVVKCINELINDIVFFHKSFLRQLPDMPITLEMIITRYPKVW